jgi:hypothetical protein
LEQLIEGGLVEEDRDLTRAFSRIRFWHVNNFATAKYSSRIERGFSLESVNFEFCKRSNVKKRMKPK